MRPECGVSPVIGTILMVAITVVLVASIYLMVFSNMINTPYATAQFVATLTVDPQHSNERNINLTIEMSSPERIAINMAKISIMHNGVPTGLKYVGDNTWSNYSAGATWYYEAKIIDVNKNDKLDSGDQLYVRIVKVSPSASAPVFHAGDEIILSLEGYNGNAKAYLSF